MSLGGVAPREFWRRKYEIKHSKKMHFSSIELDAVCIFALSLFLYIIACRFDVFEWSLGFMAIHEGWELDEILAVVAISPLALLTYSVRRLRETRVALKKAQSAETSYRAVFNACPVSVILFDPATHRILDLNDRACQDLGYTREEMLKLCISDFDALHDADAIRKRGRRHACMPDVQEFEAQHRTRSGEVRDVLVRVQGVRLEEQNLSFGAQIDITERKKVEATQQMLAREVDHRARNILSIVQSAIRLAPKHDAAAFAQSVEARVMALARVHNLLAKGQWQGVALWRLVEGELAGFIAGEGRSRADLSGPSLMLPPTLTQPFAMVIHELATNAIKYGALSRATGRIAVAWRIEGHKLHLDWSETGGPRIDAPPCKRSFGSRLLELTIKSQMKGSLEQIWRPEGLLFRMTVRLASPGADLAA
jgi:PAS domain S-box-containing protein